MTDERDQTIKVRTRAVLVDPVSMAVVWNNEAASEGAAAGAWSLAHLAPTLTEQDITALVAEVAESGEPRYLRTDLVSTGTGAMALVTSVYRLPGGMVLVIAEHAWQVEPRSRGRR